MAVVRMTHHRLGTRDVPKRAVNKMKRNGWRLNQRNRSKPEPTEPPEQEPGGSSLPEHKEES